MYILCFSMCSGASLPLSGAYTLKDVLICLLFCFAL